MEQNGVIAYLTPTSFLCGQYFVPPQNPDGRRTPAAFDFIADRDGSSMTLQETILVTRQVAQVEEGCSRFP